ncbi:L10-interacting MYB domain-containing protein-like [Abeliophyllum distichum]|uniref:L10-interacting MYB domain-containing protein-like n=1 Tax=Abeliophyllum distichum TaxID=126358 RepID=A0ABD1W0Q0_9LAMI
MFKSSAAKNWSRTQLKNHWDSIRREHKHLHELLHCTDIEYNQRDNFIVADDDWFRKRQSMPNSETCDVRKIYHSGSDSPHDTLSIFAKTRDSSDKGPVELGSSSRMDKSDFHSREKRKGSARRSKGKAKKIGSIDLSYSVEHLATVGKALASRHQNCQEQVLSCHQCIT